MDFMERELLRRLRPHIISNIYDVPSILDHLIADDIVTVNMMDDIMAKETRSLRIATLLDLLPHRGSTALEKFCHALDETGYAFLATDLRNQLAALQLKPSVEAQPDHDWLFTTLDHQSRSRLITEQEMSFIARQLSPSEFVAIGIELGFARSRLEQYQASDPHSITVQTFNMLCDWLAREAGNATVVNFVQHARIAGIDDDVIKSAVLDRSGNRYDVGVVV
jgi:hypothetical protein